VHGGHLRREHGFQLIPRLHASGGDLLA
jgi:hypothetical protein